jgi:hypothetical protein
MLDPAVVLNINEVFMCVYINLSTPIRVLRNSGHYTPQLSEAILDHNKEASKEDYINLKRFLVNFSANFYLIYYEVLIN